MSSFTARLGYLTACAATAVLALRPPGLLEQTLESASSPLRLLTEVTVPIGLLRARSVAAAEQRIAELRREEDLERQALGADQRRFVLPQSEELRAGRSFTIAEVVRRVARDADRLEVRIFAAPDGSAAPLAAGQPVVVGDHYIGRLHSVEPDGRAGVVELITRRDMYVGAAVDGPAGRAQLVVGGLQNDPRERRRARSLLAVHSPSRFDLEGGSVRVDESLAGDVPFAEQAHGFELGRLEVLDQRREERLLGVRSPVNLAAGVFQMAIVGPDQRGAGALPAGQLDPLEDAWWVSTRALTRGDPVALCEGLILAAGSSHGVHAGAAVVAGAQLVGRVERAGWFSADVRLMGDPGLSVPAVARIEGEARPLILGTLVGLGRLAPDEQGRTRVAFHWEGDLAAEPQGEVRARLFSGAGAEGVPPGLILGDARLLRDGAARVLEVTLEVDPRALGRLRVRLPEGATSQRAERTP